MKRKIYLFVQDKIGGVTVLNHNISALLDKQFDIAIVYIKQSEKIVNAASSQSPAKKKFYLDFSYLNKTSYNLEMLFSLVKSEKDAVFVANDGFELEMCNYFHCPNPVAYILHGDYDLYYDTAVKFQGIIDRFVAVSENIRQNLSKLLPHRATDIVYLKHIVPGVENTVTKVSSERLKAVFIGRLVAEKGFYTLIDIDTQLKNKGVVIDWTVVADGNDVDNEWLKSENVTWIRNIDNRELRNGLKNYALFILPSHAEGFPVSLVEAMKAGVVPLITQLPGAVDELIEQGQSGYKIPVEDVDGYVKNILSLHNDRQLLSKMSVAAQAVAHDLFNEKKAVEGYSKLFTDIQARHKQYAEKYLGNSILESTYIPNYITRTVRKIKQLIR